MEVSISRATSRTHTCCEFINAAGCRCRRFSEALSALRCKKRAHPGRTQYVAPQTLKLLFAVALDRSLGFSPTISLEQERTTLQAAAHKGKPGRQISLRFWAEEGGTAYGIYVFDGENFDPKSQDRSVHAALSSVSLLFDVHLSVDRWADCCDDYRFPSDERVLEQPMS